jgi:hypothetical protein
VEYIARLETCSIGIPATHGCQIAPYTWYGNKGYNTQLRPSVLHQQQLKLNAVHPLSKNESLKTEP